MAVPITGYFDFSLSTFVLPSDSVTNVSFKYNISGAEGVQFKVRPMLSNGTVLVFDSKKEAWISGTSGWHDLPLLTSALKLKITTIDSSDLYFLIQDSTSYSIYSTPIKKIWAHKHLAKYLDAVNVNITNWEAPISTPLAVEGNTYVVDRTPNYFLISFLTTIFAVLLLHRAAFAMLEYLYDYVKKMVASNFSLLAYICAILASWGIGI